MYFLKAQKWEIEAALLLSEVSYAVQPNVEAKPMEIFKSKFCVHGTVAFFCTSLGQKYVIAVCQRGESRVLFCAFAGTHLPGDWEQTNVNVFHETNSAEIGAPGHAGFLERALEVPLEGIERLARDSAATRVVFCGHSLGGAVSHFLLLRWLFGLQSDIFDRENVLSIAIGAPFFGGRDMLEHIKRHGWLDCFVTLVNGDDPVPRVMNLATTLVECTASCAFSTLLSACRAFLSNSNPVSALTDVGNLVQEIQKASEQDYSYLTSYLPIGQYAIFHVDGQVDVHDDAEYVSDLLGPVQLLGENPSFINGFLDRNALAHHDIKAYQNVVQANGSVMSKLCTKHFDGPQSGPAKRDDNFLSSSYSLVPVVHEISCETFTSHERQYCRIVKFCGCNLDFIADNNIVVDVDQLDSHWSTEMVLDSRISRRSTSDLVMEQRLKEDGDQEGKASLTLSPVRSKPNHDICILLRSNVVEDGGGPATTNPMLTRANCHSASDMPQDPLSFYGGQFFLDTQQHAWIMRKLFANEILYEKLKELSRLVRQFECVRDTEVLLMHPEWRAFEDVGKACDAEPPQKDSDYRRSRDELYKWIVPPNGLVVRTKLQSRMSVTVVLVSLAIGGGIVATGGLGIVGGLLGYGASLSGGYGTASLMLTGAGSVAYFMRSRLRSKYYVMLEDLVKLYTGIIPKTMAEMELEQMLLFAESEFMTNLDNGNLKRTGIPLFDQYEKESQECFKQRVELIRLIHGIKKERTKGQVVAICGPRDSGKTTLVSQLLHRPELALSTGLAGGQGETRQVIPYSISNVSGYILLDTPGLTGPEQGIRSKFDDAALNLSSTFVYIREYEGLPTDVDIHTLKKILECSARSQDPKILICLNRARYKLTEDAAGEIFHMSAELEKKKWLARLYQLRSSVKMPTWVSQLMSRSSIQVEFVELKGDKTLEAQLLKDDRTKGIWTASSIGEWISKSVSPQGGESNQNWVRFSAHMARFSYSNWQSGVRECRKAQQEEIDEETDRLLAAFSKV